MCWIHNWTKWDTYVRTYDEVEAGDVLVFANVQETKQWRRCSRCGLEQHRIVDNGHGDTFSARAPDTLPHKLENYVGLRFSDGSSVIERVLRDRAMLCDAVTPAKPHRDPPVEAMGPPTLHVGYTTPYFSPIADTPLRWAIRTFGRVAELKEERARRLLEEVLELTQAQGVDRQEAERILERVYRRPVGDPLQEARGVAFTFDAMLELMDERCDDLIRQELTRVKAIPETEWRRRHLDKVNEGCAAPMPQEDA